MKKFISFLDSAQNESMAHLIENFDEEQIIIHQLQKYFNDDNLFHSDYNFIASYLKPEEIQNLANEIENEEKDLSDDTKAEFIFKILFGQVDERYSFLPETLHQMNGDIIDNIDDYFDKKYSRLLELMTEDYQLIENEIDI